MVEWCSARQSGMQICQKQSTRPRNRCVFADSITVMTETGGDPSESCMKLVDFDCMADKAGLGRQFPLNHPVPSLRSVFLPRLPVCFLRAMQLPPARRFTASDRQRTSAAPFPAANQVAVCTAGTRIHSRMSVNKTP